MLKTFAERAEAMSADIDCASVYWPHLTAMVDAGGHVTLGRVAPMEGVAVVASEREVFAVLKRKPQESLPQLMQRLEEALARATYSGEAVNEVGLEFVLERPSARRRRSR
jgi:hypothetical protein